MYCRWTAGQCSMVPATEVTHLELNQSGVFLFFFPVGDPPLWKNLDSRTIQGIFLALNLSFPFQILSCRFGENLEQKPGFEASIFHPWCIHGSGDTNTFIKQIYLCCWKRYFSTLTLHACLPPTLKTFFNLWIRPWHKSQSSSACPRSQGATHAHNATLLTTQHRYDAHSRFNA